MIITLHVHVHVALLKIMSISFVLEKLCTNLLYYIVHSNSFSAYSTFFITGLILSMQIPFVGFQPIKTSEHMASAGVAQFFFLESFEANLSLLLSWL